MNLVVRLLLSKLPIFGNKFLFPSIAVMSQTSQNLSYREILWRANRSSSPPPKPITQPHTVPLPILPALSPLSPSPSPASLCLLPTVRCYMQISFGDAESPCACVRVNVCVCVRFCVCACLRAVEGARTTWALVAMGVATALGLAKGLVLALVGAGGWHTFSYWGIFCMWICLFKAMGL